MNALRELRYTIALAAVFPCLVLAVETKFIHPSGVLWFASCAIMFVTYVRFVYDCAANLTRKHAIIEHGLFLLIFLVTLLLVLSFAYCWHTFAHAGPPGSASTILSGDDSIYFSAAVFTTLGFGDIVPLGTQSKYFAAYEALFGATHMVTFFSLVAARLALQRPNAT